MFQDADAYRVFRCEIEEDFGSTHELSLRVGAVLVEC